MLKSKCSNFLIMLTRLIFQLLTVLFVFGFQPSVMARDMNLPESGKVSTEVPAEMQGVGITEHWGDTIDLDLAFVDDTGQAVTLRKYFDGKRPVLLTLVYYGCPNLCSFHLNGLSKVFKKMEWTIGDQFDVVAVSIDPAEKPELAEKKKSAYLKSYGRESAAKGWHFLTGSQENIAEIAKQVGFGYKWDEEGQQWVHAAAAYVLSPKGLISRYLYGIDFSAQTLRLSLVEATDNKVATLVDRLVLFCLHYDPAARSYSFYLFGVMRAAAALTVLVMVVVMGRFWWRQRRLAD